jgi:hypothetical protein
MRKLFEEGWIQLESIFFNEVIFSFSFSYYVCHFTNFLKNDISIMI